MENHKEFLMFLKFFIFPFVWDLSTKVDENITIDVIKLAPTTHQCHVIYENHQENWPLQYTIL